MLVKLILLTTIEDTYETTAYLYSKENKYIVPIKVSHCLRLTPIYKILNSIIYIACIKVLYLRIYLNFDDNFYTYLVVKLKGRIYEINCDIDNTLLLLNLFKCDVLMEKHVMELTGIPITKELISQSLKSIKPEQY